MISSYSSGAPCGAPAGSYCREVPDVSADADPMWPYLDYWNGNDLLGRAESGWQGTGGTSGAAPVWAALFALADASRDCQGTLIGFANSDALRARRPVAVDLLQRHHHGQQRLHPRRQHVRAVPSGSRL